MKQPIYLDYNATTPVDPEVMDEMLPILENDFGNASSSSPMGRKNKEAIAVARKQVADLIHASPEEIFFTSGGTESNNHAIRGIALANKAKGKHLITSSIEHPAVTEVCNYLASLGWEITILVDNQATVNPEDLLRAIRPDTTLITVMHANNEVGTIQPIREIGAIAKQHGIAFHSDAAQSIGKIETDVDTLGLDLLTIAGHKVYAPKGIGALYVKKGISLDNLMFGAGQENGMRPGTENIPYIAALGKACEIAKRDFAKNTETMSSAKLALLNGLKEALKERLHVNSPPSHCLPNTLSISITGTLAHELVSALSEQVCTSAGSACHADSIEVSPVLKAMKLELSNARETVRISTGKYTTEDEIKHAVRIISHMVHALSL